MLDSQTITALILGSFIVGMITRIIPSGVGKLITLVSLFPIIFLFIVAAVLGTKITGISDSITMINWFIGNFVPLFIAYVFEAAGAGIVEGIRKKFGF